MVRLFSPVTHCLQRHHYVACRSGTGKGYEGSHTPAAIEAIGHHVVSQGRGSRALTESDIRRHCSHQPLQLDPGPAWPEHHLGQAQVAHPRGMGAIQIKPRLDPDRVDLRTAPRRMAG